MAPIVRRRFAAIFTAAVVVAEVAAAAVGEAVATFREFLAEQWEEDAMFLNYMEAEQFAAAAERTRGRQAVDSTTSELQEALEMAQAAWKEERQRREALEASRRRELEAKEAAVAA